MSFTDPIGDMIVRIKNAQMRSHKSVQLPSSNFKVIDSIFVSPSIESSWHGVLIDILPSFSNFFISDKVWGAPLNSSLLWIKFIFENLDSSKAQSKAESPPPKIEIFFF